MKRRSEALIVRLATLTEPCRRRKRSRILRNAAESARVVGPVITVVAVYRRKNARILGALLNQMPDGSDVRLWALDEISPSLAAYTVGVGPGAKFPLLMKAIGLGPCHGHLIVADDDVVLAVGTISTLIERATSAGFGIAQPGHHWSSWITHPMLYGRPWRFATDRDFVEIGPLFVVAPGWVEPVVQGFATSQMGWGLEAIWYSMKGAGLRVGVIDECLLVHMAAPKMDYDNEAEWQQMRAALDASGVDRLWDLFARSSAWSRWRARPPWT